MKNDKETIKEAMDRRLSFLDDVPSCRSRVQDRIAQEERPVMKKKLSFVMVLAVTAALLSVAVAAGLLLSPRASASRIADKALEKEWGVTEEMQTFFAREEEELPDRSVQVTYTGVGDLKEVLGTYTASVRSGKAGITWSHEGQDTSGGYAAEAWGAEQLKQMMADAMDEKAKHAFMDRARQIAEAHGAAGEDDAPSEVQEGYYEWREAQKTAALNARVLSEEEMIRIGREFIIGSYALNDEQAGRMELYTNSFTDGDNCWYETVNDKPCFMVEYLLYARQSTDGIGEERTEKDGYYKVYVNVTDGTIEEYEYNSALAGEG